MQQATVDTIEVQVDRNTVSALEQAFHRSGMSPAALATIVARLALQEWTAWLQGAERPMTITDQNTKRVLALYEAIFPADVPSGELLYNDLRLPLGQARYIAQAISYQHGSYVQRLALEETLRSLAASIAKWKNRPAAEQIQQLQVVVSFSQACDKVYQEALATLALAQQIAKPDRKDLIAGYVQYAVLTRDWKPVARALLARLEAISAEAKLRLLNECPVLLEVGTDV